MLKYSYQAWFKQIPRNWSKKITVRNKLIIDRLFYIEIRFHLKFKFSLMFDMQAQAEKWIMMQMLMIKHL